MADKILNIDYKNLHVYRQCVCKQIVSRKQVNGAKAILEYFNEKSSTYFSPKNYQKYYY